MTWEQRKRNSWAAALEMLAPGLLSGGKATMSETRAEKAQRLVDEGAVDITSQDRFSIGGLVHSSGARYQVFIYPNGHYFCDCFWGRIHSHTDDLCAHALALQLAVERGVGDDQG